MWGLTWTLPLLLSAIDTVETAKHLEEKPWPFFLALVIGALGFIFGVWQTGAASSARRERDLHKQLHEQAQSRGDEFRRERDDLAQQLAHERREGMRLTIEFLTTAKNLARVQEELDREALKKGISRPKPKPEAPP